MTIHSEGVAPRSLTNIATATTTSGRRLATSPVQEGAKIDKAAKDFESILLGNWLQQAQHSFAEVPGEDDDSDLDSGKDQFQAIAMQSMGTSMAASGGIGIARMISKHLHRADDSESAKALETSTPSKL